MAVGRKKFGVNIPIYPGIVTDKQVFQERKCDFAALLFLSLLTSELGEL